MKFRLPNRSSIALTMIEVLVIVVGVFILSLFLLFPGPSRAGPKARKIQCTSNLKQIGVSTRNFASEHNGKFPIEVPVEEGGTKGVASFGVVVPHFLVLSYDLATPRLLNCPTDKRTVATNFDELRDINLSYFAGLDVSSTLPSALLAGDRNITNGELVTSRILTLRTNQPVAWTPDLHQHCGAVLLADGSVQLTTSSSLRALLRYSGMTTNRIALP